MLRPLILAVLVAASTAPAIAQDFPAPGTGLLTFDTVGDERRLDIESFVFSGDGVLLAYADTLYRFEPAPGGPPAGRWRAISRPGNGISAVATVGATADTLLAGRSSTMFRSVNAGGTWAVVNGGIPSQNGGPNRPDAFFALPPGHAHAGRLLAGGAILYSDDRGASWSEATRALPGVTNGRAYAFAALPSGRVLMAGAWGVIASDDGGASYAATPLWGEYLYETYSITSLATPGSIQSGAPACGLAEASLCEGAVVVGIDATQAFARAWTTNDGGRSWSASQPLPEPYDGVGTGATAGVVALGTGAGGLGRALFVGRRGVLYRTLDGGATWEAIGRMPINYSGLSAILARIGPDGHLWMSTIRNGPLGDYLYRSREPAEAAFIVAGESDPETRAARLTIRPNPSSDALTVTVDVPGAVTAARVDVVDLAGRHVASLHAGPLVAGSHTFAVDATGWAAGVYVARVAHGRRSHTARFTVTR